jgi:hypothetical protein
MVQGAPASYYSPAPVAAAAAYQAYGGVPLPAAHVAYVNAPPLKAAMSSSAAAASPANGNPFAAAPAQSAATLDSQWGLYDSGWAPIPSQRLSVYAERVACVLLLGGAQVEKPALLLVGQPGATHRPLFVVLALLVLYGS